MSDWSGSTDELRAAHDVLADFYAERLDGALERMPVDQAVLGLFAQLVLGSGLGTDVADVGCGTGRLEPFLAGLGLSPRGVDLSPGMVERARRDQPRFDFAVADVRDLPFGDAELAGVVAWYSLMFLPPEDRAQAFGELHRVLQPGGHLVTGYKAGEDEHRRAGRTTGTGVEFDIWWYEPDQLRGLLETAGFETVFWAGEPPDDEWHSTQGYLLVRKPA
ncbi:class I SAM-dependent methyltransferase [Angustibacter peucedani]